MRGVTAPRGADQEIQQISGALARGTIWPKSACSQFSVNFMSQVEQNGNKSKHNLSNLAKLIDKLYQAANPDTTTPNSNNLWSSLPALLTIDFPIKNVADQIKPSVLKQSAYTSIVSFLLENFSATSDLEKKVDILRSLSITLHDNPHNNAKVLDDLVPLLIKVADKSSKPLEVRRMAINCLGNLCCNAGPKLQSHYLSIFEVIMSNISSVEHTPQGTTMIIGKSLDLNDQALRRVASSTLRSLHLLLYEDKTIIANKLVDTVEIIRTFVFYNINANTYRYNSIFMHSKEDLSTSLSSMQLQPQQQRLSHLRQQEQNRRLSTPPSIFNNATPMKDMSAVSSDSEISDTDSINPSSRKQRDNAKIRINALLCLQAISKTSPRAFYPYWEKFIPHNFDPFVHYNRSNGTSEVSLMSHLIHLDHTQSIFTILLFDPASTVRLAVSNLLITILDGSKQFLSVAIERDAKSTSFTSLSEKVAAIARDLHNGLWCALELETMHTITVQLLKCFSLLVQNCSYDRLAKGYVSKVYHKIMEYIEHTDQRIASSALSVLHSMLDNKSAAEEIRECIGDITSSKTSKNVFSYVKGIIQQQNPSAEQNATSTSALESWNILCACTKTQPLWQRSIWEIAKPSFPNILKADDIAVRCSSIRFLNSYAEALSERAAEDSMTNAAIDWWTDVLECYLQQTTQDENSQIRALACDCMSALSERVFEAMTPRRQTLCISLLLPLAEDGNSDVRAAACHALGILVVFPSLREDPMFATDVALAMLQQMEDKSLFVKVRASWALANLCDALVLEIQNNEDFDIRDTFSLELWCKIAMAAAQAANDNDKLKSNGVRALGSATRAAPMEYFNSVSGRRCIDPIMAAVTKNIESGTLKARWNACHAAGNILRNTAFPIGRNNGTGTRWTAPFYEALLKSLKQCKNFKVRIHACSALGVPIRLAQFGDQQMFDKVLSTAQECFENIDLDLDDISFMEMRYKEQLKGQLEITLDHLKHIN